MQSYAPTSSLLGAGAVPSANAGDSNPKFSLFNLKSYRKYFNVDTQVGRGTCIGSNPYEYSKGIDRSSSTFVVLSDQSEAGRGFNPHCLPSNPLILMRKHTMCTNAKIAPVHGTYKGLLVCRMC